MKLTFHRKRRIESTIDMTPMLDTLLQVHIAFMFLMSFAASTVRLDLPHAKSSQKADVRIVVSLNAENKMYLNDDLIDGDRLAGHLAPLFDKSDKREVVLRADQALSYKHVLLTIHTIKQAGATQIHLAHDEER